MLLAVLLSTAAAALLAAPDRVSAERLRHLTSGPTPAPGTLSRLVPRAACLLAAGAVALLVGGAPGLAAGSVAALLGPGLVGRLEPAAARREREQLARQVPLALDLLAACLTGGAAISEAVGAVAGAIEGPGGRRLRAVGAAMAVGSAPTDAWAALAQGRPDDPFAAAARALARAAEGGSPVAGTVSRLAAEARADARARDEQAARRVGVVVVAPLGLCFLPAFVLLGVVPVVAGLAGPVLSGL